jgi:hypothetical protein
VKVTNEKESAEEVASSNIRKKLTMLGLDEHIEEVLLTTHDRIFFRASFEMGLSLARHVFDGVMKEGPVSGGPHDMIFSISSLDRDDWRKSYRENKRPSLQVVIGKASNGCYYGDADIDLGSPSMDLVSFLVHMAEIIVPGPTNHWQLKKRIDKEFDEWRMRA